MRGLFVSATKLLFTSGGCPRIEIFSQIEAFFSNKAYPKGTSYGRNIHLVLSVSQVVPKERSDERAYAKLRALFSKNNDELGKKSILGQPPST